MLRIFEAIKKSPFLNGNYPFRTPSKNASAEIRLTHNRQLSSARKLIKHPLRVNFELIYVYLQVRSKIFKKKQQ